MRIDVQGLVKNITSSRQNLVIVGLAALIIFFGGYAMTGYLIGGPVDDPSDTPVIKTFTDTGEEIELMDGKPVIRLFSTTWCGHCQWIGETYESVVKEYADAGKIVAYHWELDIGDDTLTPSKEGRIPTEEYDIFRKYSPGGVPTYVFGCKYMRVGNGYESTNDLRAEEAEFREVIEKLIN